MNTKKPKPRAVLDSAVLISSFLSASGLSFEILQQGKAGRFVWCCAEEILQETRRVLLEERRIRKKYHYTNKQVRDFLESVRAVAVMAQSLPEVHVIERDPKDDKILACAVATQADSIVTRDKDLLDLQDYRGIHINNHAGGFHCLDLLRDERNPNVLQPFGHKLGLSPPRTEGNMRKPEAPRKRNAAAMRCQA